MFDIENSRILLVELDLLFYLPAMLTSLIPFEWNPFLGSFRGRLACMVLCTCVCIMDIHTNNMTIHAPVMYGAYTQTLAHTCMHGHNKIHAQNSNNNNIIIIYVRSVRAYYGWQPDTYK